MKIISVYTVMLIVTIFSSKQIYGQQRIDSCYISPEDITGTWQRNDKVVGSGLNQNFEFFSDGTFVLHLGSDGDDVRGIIELKGKYRLDKNKLYFTITSRTIVDGKIGIADMGVSLCIFQFEGEKVKVIRELTPTEIPDPCFITIITNTQIKINNEVYYKVN